MQTRSQTNSERKYFNVLAAKKKHKFLRTTSFEVCQDNSVLRTSLSVHTTNIEENYCDKLRNRNSPPLRSGELAHKLRSSNSVSRLKKIYDVDIDFDEASKAWLQNKKKTGDGCYTYTS